MKRGRGTKIKKILEEAKKWKLRTWEVGKIRAFEGDNIKDYRNRITVNPEVHFGKPYIAGTRITVDNVLELIQEGISFEEIIQNYYPDLEVEDIKACIQYALDLIRKEEIYTKVG